MSVPEKSVKECLDQLLAERERLDHAIEALQRLLSDGKKWKPAPELEKPSSVVKRKKRESGTKVRKRKENWATVLGAIDDGAMHQTKLAEIVYPDSIPGRGGPFTRLLTSMIELKMIEVEDNFVHITELGTATLLDLREELR